MMENRRTFLKKMAVGAAALYGVKDFAFGSSGYNGLHEKEVRIALIGKGSMGTSDVRTALSVGGVKLVAVCDLFDRRVNEAKKMWGDRIFTTKDYREILSRKDVDAIIIATPDHWHQPIAIEAMQAGKHIYCEKPVIHKLKEAKQLLKVYDKSNVLFQMGSQGMASWGNRAAKILIQEGVIGPVNRIDAAFTAAPGSLKPFHAPEDATPQTIWWERFLGNAPMRSFDAQRFFAWRNWADYGTGLPGDLFVHVLSSVHYIMDAIGPERVYATGALRYYTNGSRDVPDLILGFYDYPDRNGLGAYTLSLAANYVDGVSKKWGSTDFAVIGSKGTIDVEWNKVTLKTVADFSSDHFNVLEGKVPEKSSVRQVSSKEFIFEVDKHYKGAHFDHFSNFFDGIRKEKPVVADALFAVRSSLPALLCNESCKRKAAIMWDPQTLSEK